MESLKEATRQPLNGFDVAQSYIEMCKKEREKG